MPHCLLLSFCCYTAKLHIQITIDNSASYTKTRFNLRIKAFQEIEHLLLIVLLPLEYPSWLKQLPIIFKKYSIFGQKLPPVLYKIHLIAFVFFAFIEPPLFLQAV